MKRDQLIIKKIYLMSKVDFVKANFYQELNNLYKLIKYSKKTKRKTQ